MVSTIANGSAADRIRRFAYDAIVRPKLASGATEVALRAGDIHSALKLHNQVPNVCSSIESRKFSDAYGLELVRREGPHRGSNAVYYFRLRTGEAPALPLVLRQPSFTSVEAVETTKSLAKPPTVRGTVYWVSCVGKKRSSPTAARDLYVSDWFTKARRYVESTGAPWFILSAKYGLVSPDAVIEPYELTLNTLPVEDRRRWAQRVQQQLEAEDCRPEKVVILAGSRYREFLEPSLRRAGVQVEVPMEGLRIGEQLNWLSQSVPTTSRSRLDDLCRFYTLLDRLERQLGGKRKLAECDGRMPWPRRGVYFFFEDGEQRSDSGEGLRVVRVGTHALKAGSTSTLWGRLSQHRGNAAAGGGNHRGSIFRSIVGAALQNRDGIRAPESWGVASDVTVASQRLRSDVDTLKRSEEALEKSVSAHIGQMPFLFVPVDDEPGPASMRGFIERGAISLLSNFGREPLDAPSGDWLGRHSDRERIRKSGLWNSNHVDEDYGADFIRVFDELLSRLGIGVGGVTER